MHIIIIAAIFLISCSSSYPPLEVVSSVALNKYQGKWYEIVRLPNSFEKGLECITATYTLRDDGDIDVTNRGIAKNNSHDEANGKAWVPNPNEPGKLKVRFFWPFAGDYWIIKLDENYRYVLIGTPSRKYFWILSREKKMNDDLLTSLKVFAAAKGFDTASFVRVDHSCKEE